MARGRDARHNPDRREFFQPKADQGSRILPPLGTSISDEENQYWGKPDWFYSDEEPEWRPEPVQVNRNINPYLWKYLEDGDPA